MIPWESFTFATSRMKCIKRKGFDLEIQEVKVNFAAVSLHIFPSNRVRIHLYDSHGQTCLSLESLVFFIVFISRRDALPLLPPFPPTFADISGIEPTATTRS